jgi:outer membrane protein assembly factor BamB
VHRFLGLAVTIALTTTLASAQWPEFRGPTGQGHSTDTNLPLEWSETRNVRWKTPIPGRGWSSPAIADGRIWVTTAVDADGTSLRALAFDLESGSRGGQRRSVSRQATGAGNPKNSRASPTPIVEADRVYVHFGADGTAALTTTGEVVWKTRLPYESQHGNGASPIVYGDLLIVSCDGSDAAFVVAFDKRTGQGPLADVAPPAVGPGVFDAARHSRRRPGPSWSASGLIAPRRTTRRRARKSGA